MIEIEVIADVTPILASYIKIRVLILFTINILFQNLIMQFNSTFTTAETLKNGDTRTGVDPDMLNKIFINLKVYK